MSGFDWSLRIPLEHLGADVFPKMFSLEMALKALTPEGNITDETLASRFEDNLVAFMNLVEAVKNYPCIKSMCRIFRRKNRPSVTEHVE